MTLFSAVVRSSIAAGVCLSKLEAGRSCLVILFGLVVCTVGRCRAVTLVIIHRSRLVSFVIVLVSSAVDVSILLVLLLAG